MRIHRTTVDTDEEEQAGIETLNDLAEICKDGEKGFHEAAVGLEKNPDLQALCLQYSRERGAFARELQFEVRQLNGEPDASGSVAGALHRAWIRITSAATAKDADAIIAECERGEDAAREAYETALNNYLPAQVTELVKRQYKKILQSHNRFSALIKGAN